ncbi:[protein-PII] uridylyltransferase [Ectothiorhodospiraceae bacterium WFHF3C12]|nr:[protein-PII] uridylyltransferase [Ectothiorhodospiraceae bacterium WFHF3C12]
MDAVADKHLIDIEALDEAMASGNPLVPIFRKARTEADQTLQARFLEGTPASELVPLRAQLVDALLLRAWDLHFSDVTRPVSLVAVGGYGRGELHPGSDVDIMLLIGDATPEAIASQIEGFLMFLWDIGLEVGHSVRSLEDCVRESEQDITVATNLMESRLLAGDPALHERMVEATGPEHVWPSRDFFEAKWQEQTARHAKYHETAYNLEPNIKEGPGGLRDIHMVGWVAKRHFGADTLYDLVGIGFLTEDEYRDLRRGQHFLWDVRFALHIAAGRREDRLLFNYQTELAAQFGYKDTEHTLAVEQFMQRYFRTIMRLSRLNEMLLQYYQETILLKDDIEPPALINKRFQSIRGFLEVTHPQTFRRYPFALLEVFLLLQQNPQLKGVRASTIRLIRQNRNLIDDRFRSDIRCRSLFMEILRQPTGITHELRRMHRYGILGRYLPAFGRITGRMQYDLFHAYTVDSHTLMVVRNLRRFTVPEHMHEYPMCSAIIARLPKPELLYLAGLFHDIAKGRGGDHSELGAEDAYTFCVRHGLSLYDSRLVAWLVRHHLLMSMTAQRRDISDPEVIHDFAQQVGDQLHLDYLYLLTVADIRGTNPSLWNSWKDALLADLYKLTKRAMRRGLGNPIDKDELIGETQQAARRRLKASGLHHMTVRSIWRHFTDDYFLRYSAEEIAWHTGAIARVDRAELPLVMIEPQGSRGGTEVFVYTKDRNDLFALTVSALDRLGLNIQDARIITTEDGHTLDSYLVLEDDNSPVEGEYRQREVVEAVREALSSDGPLQSPTPRKLPRRLQHFNTATQIQISEDAYNDRNVLELITGDRPGLLSHVGHVFSRLGIGLQNARIATIGERAEDAFFITDTDGGPLSPARREELLDTLKAELEEDDDVMRRADGV